MIASDSAACSARLCAVSREKLDRNIAHVLLATAAWKRETAKHDEQPDPSVSRIIHACSGLITLDRVHWVNDKGAHDPLSVPKPLPVR